VHGIERVLSGRGLLIFLARNGRLIPFAFLGGEEDCPSRFNIKPLARLLGAPYFPLAPTLIPLLLPARCSLCFGEPLRFIGTGDIKLPANARATARAVGDHRESVL